ncbi:lipoprotein [Azotobacter vinelandii CA]|uniref:Lipoprotein n=2 Tax=Azotobacter vinelandii TaxID=354 RepID=C1DRB7_AZOVD|nr:conjugative transfer ATPase [Azotobacter vinelandii]ACO79775.1 lipoprotein [Azotobacter vinelandii DJ]AGK14574.1 lipoprotein [Azotobacter vinelandii CA]AGK21493.1 lipoprotein [Azotobacter vinelandii CA6]GLK61019.1 conjugative transfer ATPase, PFL_4706 family protein [Azotobacter vinelandii]
MGLFERFRGRARMAEKVEPEVQIADVAQESHEAHEAHEAPDIERIEAATERHLERLTRLGIPDPTDWRDPGKRPATQADVARLYEVAPSFVDLLPWVEYLPDEQAMLLEDGHSWAAFFELTPIGTEGRDPAWLRMVRDALENALQDSFDELDSSPWVVQMYAQDETNFDDYLQSLRNYIQPRAAGSDFTEVYLALFKRHLEAIAKPGGLFEDTAVSQLPWRGQQRRVRLVVYRRVQVSDMVVRGQAPAPYLAVICDRLVGALANAGVVARRMDGQAVRTWLVHWFNPRPDHLGATDADIRRFLELVCQAPEGLSEDDLPLASGTDFAQNLFYREPQSSTPKGLWYFDAMPHRVVVVDRLRDAPKTGHLTGETRKSDAYNALFDRLPEDTVLCLTMVATPQDLLEGHLEQLSKKAVGDTQASIHTRDDVEHVRTLLGRKHKLYRGNLAFYLRGTDHRQLDERTTQLSNALLGAGMSPVQPQDEVAPLNSYLRWLPCNFDPNERHALDWYVQFMFVQHIANLAPIWGRSTGTGHPGVTLFNRGGAPVTFDPLNRLDRQMNAHLFIFGPTGSGKSASATNILSQVIAIYRPRLFIVEAGNSFGLLGEFAKNLGLSVNRARLAPGSGVNLAPFADAIKLIEAPGKTKVLDMEASDDHLADTEDEQRDILGEMEITARLMVTGGEAKEDARLTRADRSALRQCILDAAKTCSEQGKTVLPEDVRDALRRMAADEKILEPRRNRLMEMAEAMSMFCMGAEGEMFNRPGSPWPEADLTIVDLATYAREGYEAQMAIAYISLLNTVNNIAERDQFKGRPLIFFTDEGHIQLKVPLLSPYAVKITKMWRKLGAWFWMATQNVDDVPPEASALLNMIEWWICLNMPPDEVEKIARFRELTPAQKAMMLSARKENGKFTEGVVLAKRLELLFRVVPPSLYLALAMTEPEEKKQRYDIMMAKGCDELGAALEVAADLDRKRGITS